MKVISSNVVAISIANLAWEISGIYCTTLFNLNPFRNFNKEVFSHSLYYVRISMPHKNRESENRTTKLSLCEQVNLRAVFAAEIGLFLLQ